MSNGVKISRGNPRSSSVGEEEDVEKVRYRTTTTLDPSSIIAVEDCGIPLDCASAGDSFEAQDPCANADFDIYGVMGQEDKYRQEEGRRVERGGTARVVVTTTIETDITLHYKRNPSDEDNPVFNETISDISLGYSHHEFFFPVDPSTLYAFYLEISVTGCPGVVNDSNIYYLSTGDTVQFRSKLVISEPILSIIDSIESQILDTNMMTGAYAGRPNVWGASWSNTTPSTYITPTTSKVNLTTTETSFGTTYTIS